MLGLLLAGLFFGGVTMSVHSESVVDKNDFLNRLIQVDYPDRIITDAYDAAGNRTLSAVQVVNPSAAITSLDLTDADLATPGSFPVSVINPAPGGGPSNTSTFTVTDVELSISTVTPAAGRVSGGQQINLTGAFAGLSTVTMGGTLATWSYTNNGDTSAITVTTPAHAVGAVGITLLSTTGTTYSKANAFAYLPTVFTDDTLVAGVTTVKAQHIIELRDAVDAMRAVAGLSGAPWTDPALAAGDTIRAIHIQDLRTYLDDAATRLGYSTSPYTDPGLTSGFVIKRIHIEELRQRIRTIAG
jgi:hypothetical protein